MENRPVNYNNSDIVQTKLTGKNEVAVTPFQIKDCALITRTANGLPALNLREFRERVATCPIESVYHHFCQTVLRPSFDDPEFNNDFSLWCRRALHDHVLAERLEILDPYDYPDFEDLRREVLDVVDDRLSEVDYIPWVTDNRAFHFLCATTVVFDTGKTITSPENLSKAISQMTTSSIYYHFWEARRRREDRLDDFSAWLMDWDGRGQALIEALSRIDFYFLSLRELQENLWLATKITSGKY